MKEYFLTIAKHQVKDYVSECQITDVINELKLNLPFKVISIVYEISRKYDQLHSHVLIKSNRYINYKLYTSIKGFRVYWLAVKDRKPVISYMNKDSCNKYEQEQILITNYYRHNYGFDPRS